MVVSRERKFLELYQKYRYEHQIDFYRSHTLEFEQAHRQAIVVGAILMIIAALASALSSYSFAPPLRLTYLIIAAISPVLYTALTAYSSLYAFEQQAKLYQDTVYALLKVHTLSPDIQQSLSEQAFAEQVHDYIDKVENILLVEQGQWGQLAGKMRPPEV